MFQPFFPPILTGSSACEYPHHTPAPRSNPRNSRSGGAFPSPATLKLGRVEGISGDLGKSGEVLPESPDFLKSPTFPAPVFSSARNDQALAPSSCLIAIEVGVCQLALFKPREELFKFASVVRNLKMDQLVDQEVVNNVGRGAIETI